METLWQDMSYGARMLRKKPGFTLIAVVTLGLGIGANTAIFSAVNALLLRPLPIADVERVVHGSSLREGFDPFGVSPQTFNALRERGKSFESLGLGTFRFYNLIEGGEPEQIQGATVMAEYLTTLGAQPMRGRLFTAAEDQPNGANVALIGYGLWQRRYGGNENIIGQTVRFGERNCTIIGVTPPGFDLPFAAEVWLPLQLSLQSLPPAQMAARNYDLVARLRPGASVEQADAESKSIARQLEQEQPQTQRGWGFTFISMRGHLLGDLEGRIHQAIYALLAAVGFLLLICCVNVASLLLAQGAARERELAVRQALGAGGTQCDPNGCSRTAGRQSHDDERTPRRRAGDGTLQRRVDGRAGGFGIGPGGFGIVRRDGVVSRSAHWRNRVADGIGRTRGRHRTDDFGAGDEAHHGGIGARLNRRNHPFPLSGHRVVWHERQ